MLYCGWYMAATKARRLYAITRYDDICGYVCVHSPAAMDKNWNTDLTFSLIFQVVNGLLDLSLDLLGFAGAGGTPHSLLSSKLMKQATCWWSFLLTSAPSRSPPKGRCRLLWFWFLTKGYVTHGHGKWKILGTKGKGNVPRWGNVLTHVGQRACPTWARCVPKNGTKQDLKLL